MKKPQDKKVKPSNILGQKEELPKTERRLKSSEVECSSDPNDWLPKDGPHPTD